MIRTRGICPVCKKQVKISKDGFLYIHSNQNPEPGKFYCGGVFPEQIIEIKVPKKRHPMGWGFKPNQDGRLVRSKRWV